MLLVRLQALFGHFGHHVVSSADARRFWNGYCLAGSKYILIFFVLPGFSSWIWFAGREDSSVYIRMKVEASGAYWVHPQPLFISLAQMLSFDGLLAQY
jgi:hypothetical protein